MSQITRTCSSCQVVEIGHMGPSLVGEPLLGRPKRKGIQAEDCAVSYKHSGVLSGLEQRLGRGRLVRPGGSHTGMDCDVFPGAGRGQRRVCKVGRYPICL